MSAAVVDVGLVEGDHLAPAQAGLAAECAMHYGFVRPPYIEVVWTLPAPIGAYLSSGGDPKALFLQQLNLSLALLMWWPFVWRYDSDLLAAERPQTAAVSP